MRSYAYCSSKNCGYAQQYGNWVEMMIDKNVPMQKFCPMCGSQMLGECPSCKAPRESMDYNFCPVCGKPYK